MRTYFMLVADGDDVCRIQEGKWGRRGGRCVNKWGLRLRSCLEQMYKPTLKEYESERWHKHMPPKN